MFCWSRSNCCCLTNVLIISRSSSVEEDDDDEDVGLLRDSLVFFRRSCSSLSEFEFVLSVLITRVSCLLAMFSFDKEEEDVLFVALIKCSIDVVDFE